jgi:hypothetical protein
MHPNPNLTLTLSFQVNFRRIYAAKIYLETPIPGVSVPVLSSIQLVHTIVALIFLSRNSDVQTVVHHRNGISWDNRVHNLKWVTLRENSLYAHGTPFQVIEQGSNKICNYFSMKEIIDQYKLLFVPSQSFEHKGFLVKMVVITYFFTNFFLFLFW